MTTPPTSRLLHEAGGISVFHRPGSSPWTLVAFGPRQASPSVERWWAMPLGRREGMDLIGIAPTADDWFPSDTMAALLPVIRAAAKPAIVTYGFGMGGYGALKHAAAIGARGVLALSPRDAIDPADGVTEAAGQARFDPARHAGMRIVEGDFPDGAMVLWDPAVPDDARHAAALSRLPGIRSVPLRLAGHATAAIFAETGRLMPVAEAILAGRSAEAVAGIRAARRESPTVLLAAAALLEAHGHRRWAARAQASAERRMINPARAIEARARAFARLGDAAQEIEALRAWVAEAPREIEPHLRLAERLLEQGRPAEAVQAARQSIAAGIAEARLHDLLQKALVALRQAQASPAPAAPALAARPEPVLLGRSAGLRLLHWPGTGPGTLVVFTPAGGSPAAGPAEWWGQGVAARLGWSTIAFAAHEANWYPAGEMEHLLPLAMAAMPPGPRITYGLEMGGYAALKFGRALGARASLALAPAYSIDPADMPGDPRARQQFDPRRNAGMAIRPPDMTPLPIIAFDPLLAHDRAQARRIALVPRVRAVPMRHGGRGLAAMLVEAGGLVPLLTATLMGDAPRAAAILREARRVSPQVRTAVAGALETRGRHAWAVALRRPVAARPIAAPQAATVPPPPVPPAASVPAGEVARRFAIQARALRLQFKHEAEAELLGRWIAADPAAIGPRVNLVRCLELLGRNEEAAAALLDAMRAGLWDGYLHDALLRAIRRGGSDPAFAEALEAELAKRPRNAETSALFGEIHQAAGRPAEAEAAFLAALGQRPGHRLARLGLAVLEPLADDGAAAGPHLAALLDELSSVAAPEADWLQVTDRLWHADRHGAAILAVAAARRLHPDAANLTLRHGRFLLAAARQEESVACFVDMTQSAPQDARGWQGLLDALMETRRHVEGLNAARRAAALHPGNALLALRQAGFLLALDDHAGAERAARQAIELDPSVEAGHLLCIDALRRQERRRDAIALARSALERVPASLHLAITLGHMLQEERDAAGAAAAFGRATAMAGAPREAWVGLAETLAAAGRAAEAEAAARQGLDALPDARELRAILGQLLLERGEEGAARDALAEAIEQPPDSPAVSLAMADAWLRQGRRREALQLLLTAVEAEPGHVEAELRLGQLLLAEGRIADAAVMFERVTAAAPDQPDGWVGLSDAERLRKRIKPALAAYRRAASLGADAATMRELRYRLFGDYDA